MSVSLLDINVLITLFWPAHGSHKSAHKWFAKHAGSRWATCSFTQAGFVRIVSNPKFSPAAVSPKETIRILAANLQNPNHVGGQLRP